MAKKKATTEAAAAVRQTRVQLRSLLAGNPNYFGNEPDSGFKQVKAITTNTNFEELTSLGYNPRRKRLFATLDIKQSTGYQGDLCSDGSREHVRFYVDFGAGWQDVGAVATNVHDIDDGVDCEQRELHPLTYSVELPYSPLRRWCTAPQLPVVRAILSWNIEPPAGNPNWRPIFGNVIDCPIQIDKSYWFPGFIDELVAKAKVPQDLIDSIKPLLPPAPQPIGDIPDLPDLPEPGPGPLPDLQPAPMPLEKLIQTYSTGGDSAAPRLTVEPTRFAFDAVQAIQASPANNIELVTSAKAVLDKAGVDITDLVAKVEDTTGDISFEELVDVGLDHNRERLDATYVVKKSTGFSGGLCTAGSTEYVSFWVDWDDTCNWEYLSTVEVKAYDFDRLPDGGLCYTASLPVDLTDVKRTCVEPKVARVRAVLSWNSPPSTTDPDDVPTWGNRLDAHVLIPRLEGAPGTLTVVGGIATADIDDITGMASGSATFVDTGASVYSPLGLDCPFGGLVVVRGPAVEGHRYRLRVIDPGGSSITLTEKIWVTPVGGSPVEHTGAADGWFDYLPWTANEVGVLGYYRSSGDELVTIELEIEGIGVVDSQRVQLDNTWPDVSITITAPGGDCDLVQPGQLLEGEITAFDTHMGGWSVVVDGGPAGFGPVPTTTGSSGNLNTPAAVPPPDGTWSFRTDDLEQCGYVVRVAASDRAIVNSQNSQHHRSVDVGFCIIE